MALFRFSRSVDAPHFIRGDGLYLRPAASGDFFAWTRLREVSRAFLTPWEPVWPADDLTQSAFRRRLRRHAQEMADDLSYSFLIFRDADQELLGGLTIGYVRRGVAQSATLGYWMGAPHAGKGHMTRAVRAACNFAFAGLRLHRIEAACVPHNVASQKVLQANGFQYEGFARAYLRINGFWQDHELYALVESDGPTPNPRHP